MDELKQQVEEALKVAEISIAPSAKLVGQFRDELIKNGFTREEALKMCMAFKIVGGN